VQRQKNALRQTLDLLAVWGASMEGPGTTPAEFNTKQWMRNRHSVIFAKQNT
jgi:hypothetical protein